MTITFDENDERLVCQKLEDEGISLTDARVQDVLYNIRAAFQQQFEDEANYMINEFEADL